jgi:hypothetical protein
MEKAGAFEAVVRQHLRKLAGQDNPGIGHRKSGEAEQIGQMNGDRMGAADDGDWNGDGLDD